MYPFEYATHPHNVKVRKHGPDGYSDYVSFKPWLRDEFGFCCILCRARERWCVGGQDAFGVDHLLPKSKHPGLRNRYSNLVYCCNKCNSLKGEHYLDFDPAKATVENHVLSNPEDGTVSALTTVGALLIEILRLNRAELVALRRALFAARTFESSNEPAHQEVYSNFFDFPEELPELNTLRCFNSRPQGVSQSYHALKQAGTLPPIY